MSPDVNISDLGSGQKTVPRIIIPRTIIPGIIFPSPFGLAPIDAVISANQAYVVVRTGDTFEFCRGNIHYVEHRNIRGSYESVTQLGSNEVYVFQGGMGNIFPPWINSPQLNNRPLVENHNRLLMDSVYPLVNERPWISVANGFKLSGGVLGGILGWRIARRLLTRCIDTAVAVTARSFLRGLGGFLARRCLPMLFGGFVGIAISAALFAYELKGLYRNIELYRDFQNLNSRTSDDAVNRLDREMREKGFTPERPAEITFGGHSGAGAVGTVLAARSNSPNSRLSFRVRRLVMIASPLTRQHLENIPSNVEVVYIEPRDDSLHSFVRNIGWIGGLDICQDMRQYSRSNFHFVLIEGGHLSSMHISGENHEEENAQRLVYRNNFTEEQLSGISDEARLIINGIFPPQSMIATNVSR